MTAAAAAGEPAPRAGITGKPWWPWLKRAATLVFFGLVSWLLVAQGRAIDWPEVFAALRAYPPALLLGAMGLSALSFGLYSCFDLLGRHYTGHTLRTPTVMLVTFISYVFNLNLGSLVGGVAFRYRMYSKLGLATATITRVLTLSMLTNWLGYLLLAGAVFTVVPLALPPDWTIDSEGLRLVGIALLGLALAYLLMCGWSRKRTWTVRGHELLLPPPGMALVQLAMSSANWMIMAGAVYVLLQGRIPFSDVLSVLLVAAVAGVIAHVPAGLGVLEAVFVALLAHRVPQAELLAALLGYRALYYIAPLAAAAVLYLGVELRARKRGPLPQRP